MMSCTQCQCVVVDPTAAPDRTDPPRPHDGGAQWQWQECGLVSATQGPGETGGGGGGGSRH